MGPAASSEDTYSPVDICQWLEIPRTTLFRWEASGEIPEPIRGPRGHRIYTKEHVRQIGAFLRQKLSAEVALGLQHGDGGDFSPAELLEPLYLSEFFAGSDPQDGLRQLKGL